MNNNCFKTAAIFLAASIIFSCSQKPGNKAANIGLEVRTQSAENAQKAIAEVKEKTSIEIADGLKVDLWATDSLAPDPIAMSIDNQGSIFISRAVRPHNSEFDIRGHRDWMTESIKMQTIEDRRAFLRKIFSDEKSEENSWVTDLNGDGIHNWKDLAVEKDEVWKVQDTDGDGIADKSTRVLKDFHEEITDVANGVLIREHDMYVSIGPDVWRLLDTDGDGYYDEKTSMVRGFNVHIGFGGHGVSGLIEGPDGKIYVGAGDIGANLTDNSGKNHFYPNQGVIVRFNPDGSDFEVFSHGHRNTHEFVFDKLGNIIAGDNDGDHPGESERLVHIVEGSDSGWRINWQFGKYTDPKNNEYKVWMDERLYVPRWKDQAAHIIPPIRNFHNGPTGMQFNPGAGLGKKWQDKFFIVEFVGNPTRSHIWSFSLRPKGASFDFKDETDVISGVLPTGMRFGPDGALYFADWINGWNPLGIGRIWKLDVTEAENNLKKLRAETQKLLGMTFKQTSIDSLYDLLAFEDMRVRQKAQFELVTRPEGKSTLLKRLSSADNQIARVHAVWGLGQLLYKDASVGNDLMKYLADTDSEVIAQVLKVMGDARYAGAEAEMISLLTKPQDRVKFFAAQALGRIQSKAAFDGLVALIASNNDKDVYLRHAPVLALSRIGEAEKLGALHTHKSPAVRLGALLALRRMRHANASLFLGDSDEYIVTNAARAINDDLSIEEGLPVLASMLNTTKFRNEPLLRRAINACLRVGGDENVDRLITFASDDTNADNLKAEAMATLASWAEPSPLDRVDGRYRGFEPRDISSLRKKVAGIVPSFLSSNEEASVLSTVSLIKELGLSDFSANLMSLFNSSKSAKVQSAVIESLVGLKYSNTGELVAKALQSGKTSVRTTALKYLDTVDLPSGQFANIAKGLFEKGSKKEKQQLLRVMPKLKLADTEPVYSSLIKSYGDKTLDRNLRLELEESILETDSDVMKESFAKLKPEGDEMTEFANALYGGDYWNGRKIFRQNPTAQCSRCHVVKEQGGEVGPDLTHIASTLSREQLLQSLVMPSARLAPGFGFVTLTLKDGQEVSGVLMEETDTELKLKVDNPELLRVPLGRIAERDNMPSSMPPMGMILEKREIRDLVAYLASLK